LPGRRPARGKPLAFAIPIAQRLEARDTRPSALILVPTRELTTQVADELADMNQRARERALERFDAGKVSTLVATDVAARGLDLDHITQVINFDPPTDNMGYVHRVGRTARAGRDGTGIMLVLPE
jgi:superfamily II DNA/RNA helicase